MKKLFLHLIIIIVIAGAFFAYLLPRKAERPETRESAEGPRPAGRDYPEITGLSFAHFVSGKKKMEITAEKASVRPKRIGLFITPLVKEAHMSGPRISFFNDGAESASIAADSGRMDMGNKKMILRGDVVLITDDDKKLFTKEMTVDPEKGTFSIGGSFVLHDKNGVTKGKGLRSDIELKDLNPERARDQ